MKYLQKTFSVPVAGPAVTQDDWDAIFGRRCRTCGGPAASSAEVERMSKYRIDLAHQCMRCFNKEFAEALDRELANDLRSFRERGPLP